MKPLTLNKTWRLCLRMWKWIAEQRAKGNFESVEDLKEKWLLEQGFRHRAIRAGCFFCAYAVQKDKGCSRCPARLINSRFHCCNTTYHYRYKPLAFYKKLLELNKKRLSKK